MNKRITRIQKIELTNFKNIKFGTIDLNNSYKKKEYFSNRADVAGIYGQNGSGKSAVVEAFNLLNYIACGLPLPNNLQDYIYQSENKATLSFTFYTEHEESKYLSYYEFSIEKAETGAEIVNEKFSKSKFINGKPEFKTVFIETSKDSKTPVLPQKRYKEFLSYKGVDAVNLKVQKVLATKENKSFVFSEYIFNIFQNNYSKESWEILNFIRQFACVNLFVITNRDSAPIGLNLLPFSYRCQNENQISVENMGINLNGQLNGQLTADLEGFEKVKKILTQLNVVLCKIVPGMTLEIREMGRDLTKENKELIKYALIALRGEFKIPLQYESDGIKKIISVLSSLINMFNDPSICLVIDEFDSGIFEYIFGEILSIVEEKGRGQLIFTSHNLRALEMLDKKSVVFSTANPDNRFIKMTNVAANNNLRDVYLRGIDLGGAKESLYEETNHYEIAYAFKKAGDIN